MPLEKIAWLEWKKETFELAKKLSRPILLDIFGPWCHWCHEMDETTYSNDRVAEIVNQNFIPIRVNTDKRPDINERYNAGGWPTTATLTTNGTKIQSATYLPPDQMIIFLKSSLNAFNVFGEKIEERSKNVFSEEIAPKKILLNSSEIVESVASQAKRAFDSRFGGFGEFPKFPMPELLGFLEFYCLLSRDTQTSEMLKQTLLAMYEGELFDKEEFGFFRYSTTRDWSVPHYEKMIEDNAQLLVVYMDAFKLFGETAFFEASKKTLEYIMLNMFDRDEKVFFASQDADEEYYKLSLEDRKNSDKPFIDTTVFSDWNALMVQAMLKASVFFGEPAFEKTALDCLKSVYRKNFSGGTLLHFSGKKEKQEGFLSDYAFLIQASIKAFIYSQDKFFLEKAVSLFGISKEKFFDEKKQAFSDISGADSVGLLQEKKFPFRLNSVMAENCLFFNEIIPTKECEELFPKLNSFAVSDANKFGVFGALSAKVESLIGFGPLKISVVLSDKKNKGFLTKVLYNDFNNMVVLLDEKKGPDSAVVCRKNQCLAPINELNGLDLYEKIR